MIFFLALLASCNKTKETPDLTADEVPNEALATNLFDKIIKIGEEAKTDTRFQLLFSERNDKNKF